MIELERHIEILLLDNDCVIVPNLGGFMAHHVDAKYHEEEGVFLPPIRTLGFNPQLKINDSLLAQSYIEAYDISYPEAIQRIEDEVNELTQHLQNFGRYELNNIGILELNEDGNYVFTPCEAGILSPTLYGLNSFEMKTLQMLSAEAAAKKKAVKQLAKEPSNVVKLDHPMKHLMEDADATKTAEPIDEVENDDNDVVRIKFTWIRNAVAVAAILLAVFFVSMPTGQTEMMTRTISNLNNQLLFGMMSKDTNTSAIDFKRKDAHKPATKAADALLDTIKPVDKPAIKPATRQGYCIVLASHVNKQNAEDFIARLAKRGYEGAEIYVHRNVTRIVYGQFDNETDAYKKLQSISKVKDLEEAWVYKYNEKSE